MRTAIRVVLALSAVMALAACSDDRKRLLEPEPSKILIGPPIGPLPGPGVPTITLPKPDDFVEIVAGSNHTCARKINGNVYCWGLDDQGQAGMIGKGYCYDPQPCVDHPTRVSSTAANFSTAVQITAGSAHTCALDGTGAAFCWGSSSNGQIGGGFFGSAMGPQPVGGLGYGQPPLTFTSLGAGGVSSCGIAAAGLFCWGAEFKTPGPTSNSPYPDQVFPNVSFTKVTVGYLSACASWQVNGTSALQPYCWGRNYYGEVGQDPVKTPSVDALLGTTFAGNAVARVAMMDDFTCFDQLSGIVQCVGDNQFGQLGNGTTSALGTFVLQNVGNGQALHGVTTSDNHACALDASGAAYCWGYGYNGQLGNGASMQSATPQLVVGGHTFRAIAAGSHHTCAIGTDNRIYCWGEDLHGQLGTRGANTNQPVQTLDPT